MNKKKIILIAGISLTILIGAIIIIVLLNREKKTNEPIKDVKPQIQEKIKIVDINSNSRPYAVMINNIAVARQVQSGLSDAYMVYEIIVEGGITRFLALYKDAETAKIGSVRSARHYYLDYVLENDAIFVHWGYSEQAKQDIKTLKINNINGLVYENSYFYRDKSLNVPYEHTGFTTMELLNKGLTKLDYKAETDKGLLLDYSAKSIDLGNYESNMSAKGVTVQYSKYTKNTYEYDETEKVYKRFVNGSEHIDHGNAKQLTVKNIIVYKVKNYTIAGDDKGRQMLDNIGTGEGYYISEGKAIKIKWSKADRESKTVYTDEKGNKLKVNDGNTFIQILPLDGLLEIE